MKPTWTTASRSARSRLPLRCKLLIAMLLASAASAAGNPSLIAGVFEPPRQAPDFSLDGSDGSELKLRSFRGKVVVLAFGFTSCPDVCPVTLATLAQARRKLGALGDGLQVVYVTVDAERDDAGRTPRPALHPPLVGGTGTAERLGSVRKAYVVAATRRASGSATLFAHSSFTYLIDRQGRLRALMPYGHSADDYAHDLRILMARKP